MEVNAVARRSDVRERDARKAMIAEKAVKV